VTVGIALYDSEDGSFAGLLAERADVGLDAVQVDLGPDAQTLSEREFSRFQNRFAPVCGHCPAVYMNRHPLWYLNAPLIRHLNTAIGSSRIPSSAYQKWATRNSLILRRCSVK